MNQLPNVVFQIEAELSLNVDKGDDTNDTPTLGTTGSYTDNDEEDSTLSKPTISTDLSTALKSTLSRPGIIDSRTGEPILHQQAAVSTFLVCGWMRFGKI